MTCVALLAAEGGRDRGIRASHTPDHEYRAARVAGSHRPIGAGPRAAGRQQRSQSHPAFPNRYSFVRLRYLGGSVCTPFPLVDGEHACRRRVKIA
jgi:hypothetical protein